MAIPHLSYFFYMHYHELSVSTIKKFHKRNVLLLKIQKLCLVYALYTTFDNIIILVTSKKLKNEYLKTCYHSN